MLKFTLGLEVDGRGLLAEVRTTGDDRPYDGVYAKLYDARDGDYANIIGEVHGPDEIDREPPDIPALAGAPGRRAVTWYLMHVTADSITLVRLLPCVGDFRVKGLTYDKEQAVFQATGLHLAPSTTEYTVHEFGEPAVPDIAGDGLYDPLGRKTHSINYNRWVAVSAMTNLMVHVEASSYYPEEFYFTLRDGEFVPCNNPVGDTVLVALVTIGTFAYGVPAPPIDLEIRVATA